MQKSIHRYWWIGAAAVLILSAGSWLLLQDNVIPEKKFTANIIPSNQRIIEHTNSSAKPLLITLEDGSQVQLSTNSKISYGKKLDSTGTRDVYLSGEASFNVTKIRLILFEYLQMKSSPRYWVLRSPFVLSREIL